MAEHTPTPWRWDDDECTNAISIRFDPGHPNARGDEVASIYRDGIDNNDEMRADAAFIVEAVNNHRALVDTLQDIIKNSREKYAVERAIDGMRGVVGRAR